MVVKARRFLSQGLDAEHWGKIMRHNLVKISLITIVFIVLVTPVIFESNPSTAVFDNSYPVQDEVLNKDMMSSEDIDIYGNGNFSQYGFTGSGTVADPYELEGQTFQDSIRISDTTAHFEIRNCRFEGGYSGASLSLVRVSNGLVTDCVMTSGSFYVSRSVDVILKNNVIYTETSRYPGHPIMMVPNFDLGRGIGFWNVNHSLIENNTIFHTEYGLEITGYDSTVRNNIIHTNLFHGLVTSAVESLFVGNSIFGHVGQVYNTGTSSGSPAIYSIGTNSTFYQNSIGWNDVNVEISDNGGVKPNAWDNDVDTGNAWDDYVGSGTYILETDNVDNYPSLLEDSEVPIISGPINIAKEWGSPDSKITWTIDEDFPTLYEIFLDDEFVWGGGIYGQEIIYPLVGLDMGTYEYTLKVFDAEGHIANHTINLEITPMNHNLQWGIEANTTLVFDFYTAKDTNVAVTQIRNQLAMTVTSLPEITDKMEYITICPFETEWLQSNDTMASLEYYFAGAGLVWAAISPAVPIGNWSLLSSFFDEIESEYMNTSIIDEATRWGLRLDIAADDMVLTSETTWFKSDGSLQKVFLSIESDVGSAEVSLQRVNDLLSNPTTMIVIAGGIIGVVVVVVVLVKLRRR